MLNNRNDHNCDFFRNFFAAIKGEPTKAHTECAKF